MEIPADDDDCRCKSESGSEECDYDLDFEFRIDSDTLLDHIADSSSDELSESDDGYVSVASSEGAY